MVRFLPEVEDYLENLVEILYQREYFGFEESSYDYVLALVNYILEFIAISNPMTVPIELESKGDFYIVYNSSKRTSWYILFEREDSHYLITYITNNHQIESSYFGK